MSTVEWQDNSGDWFFRSEILSEKLTRNTTNEHASHENKPRLVRHFESGYTDADGQVVLNNFETEHQAILSGVRIISPAELSPAKTILGADLLFPTGPGIGPFTRRPVINCSTCAFYVPTASGGDDWFLADMSGAVAWHDSTEWVLVNLAVPQPALDEFKKGIAFYLRTAGLDGDSNVTFPTSGAHFFVFWHAHGPVAAYA